MRLASGQEALVTRVLTKDAKAAYGFNFQLDATASRHMAMWHAGVRRVRPRIEPVLGHAWETEFLANRDIPWNIEPAFATLKWLP
jgi:hypothetical protein